MPATHAASPQDHDAGGPSAAASAFADALAGAAHEGLPEPAPDPRVAAAFALGWQLAILYRPEQRRTATPAAAEDLPSVSRLSDAEVVALGLDRVQVAIHGLQEPVQRAGLRLPDVAAVRRQLDRAPDASTRPELIRTLHLQLNSVLGAVDFRLGTAYGIGRQLADTCRNPTTLDELRSEFATARTATLASWLDDLASGFPPHASHAVRKSLLCWREWVDTAEEPLTDDARALLRRQGELWRALLSGEKLGTHMLEIDHYLEAAERLFARTRALSVRFLRRFPALMALIFVLFAGGVSLVVTGSSSPSGSGSASVVAGIGGVLTSIGLTWRGVGGTVGRAVGKLERPLWGAEIDASITQAITLLPGAHGSDRTGGRRTLAREMVTQPSASATEERGGDVHGTATDGGSRVDGQR